MNRAETRILNRDVVYSKEQPDVGSREIVVVMIGEERRGELDEIIYYQFIDGDDAAKYADCMRVLRETVLLSQKASLVANWAKSDDPDKGKKLMEIEKKIKQLKNGGDI